MNNTAPPTFLGPLLAVERFQAILLLLHPERELGAAQPWMRFAALALVPTPGRPDEVVHQLRSEAAQLRRLGSWFDPTHGPLRFLIASLLRPAGLDAAAFIGAVARDAERLSTAGVPITEPYGTLATAIRTLARGQHELSAIDAERVAHMQRAMARYHWWLTSASSVPVAVLLALEPGEVPAIAARAAQVYDLLRAAGCMPGRMLHQTSHLLQLTGLEPALAASRLNALAAAFRERASSLGEDQLEAMALLCLLDQDPALIARTHQACLARLLSGTPPLTGPLSAAIAADLAFLQLVRYGAHAVELTDLAGPSTASAALQVPISLHRYHAIAAIVHLDQMLEASSSAFMTAGV